MCISWPQESNPKFPEAFMLLSTCSQERIIIIMIIIFDGYQIFRTNRCKKNNYHDAFFIQRLHGINFDCL